MQTFNAFLGFLVLGITILVMAVPEGLPMAVTISLAYSVNKMKKMNNLVKKMDACETMGSITDICSDKTGTLTENNMTVVDIYCAGLFSSVSTGVTANLKKDSDLIDMCEIAAINSTATPDFSKSLKDQLGNKTEMALLEFANSQMGVNWTKLRTLDNVLEIVPFSSSRKKMVTLYKKADGSIWLYVKGAPEIVLGDCSFHRTDGKTFRIEKDWRQGLDSNILKLMNGKMERTLAISKVEVNNYKEGDDITVFEKDMVFLGVFGIMDPVRQDVPEAVRLAQNAKITVRMVTGDNTQIGAAIAKECGILSKDYNPELDDNQVLDGKKFRELVGDLQWREEIGEDKKKIRIPYVKDMHAFQKLEPKLRVIGRCLPTDKLLLVTGLQTLGKVVSVTGDGANDAPALNKADVGLGMGKTGTDICREAAKIVLLDDNFSSIITAVKFVTSIHTREETSSMPLESSSSSS